MNCNIQPVMTIVLDTRVSCSLQGSHGATHYYCVQEQMSDLSN